MNIVQTMTDPNLFGDFFSDKSWTYWRELLAGFYGLPCDPSIFKELTHRDRPHAPSSELWMVIGRRGGKSQIAALLAVYEAVFRDYSPQLSKGEVATIAVIASDRKQARTIMRYIQGLLDTPMLRELVSRETHESIELMNRSVIEVFTASHRTTRGYTLACAICDEIAFWHSDGANPDREILQALRPSLATLNGKLIALSSPYARRGVLYQTYKDYFGRNSEILVAQAPTRTMNPTIPKSIVDRSLLEDRSMAQAEYLAEFRTDVEAFISHEVVEQAMRQNPLELAPDYKTKYRAFVDPSGGSGDAYTLAIGHREGGCAVIDCVRVIRPPFSPEAATTELANVCKNYGIVFVKGDNYA